MKDKLVFKSVDACFEYMEKFFTNDELLPKSLYHGKIVHMIVNDAGKTTLGYAKVLCLIDGKTDYAMVTTFLCSCDIFNCDCKTNVKIGDMVYFSWYSSGVNISSSGSGNAQIEGLPFSSGNASEEYWQFNFTHGTALSSTACSGGYIAENSDRMVFILHGSIASPTWASGGGKYIMVAGSYRTSA